MALRLTTQIARKAAISALSSASSRLKSNGSVIDVGLGVSVGDPSARQRW